MYCKQKVKYQLHFDFLKLGFQQLLVEKVIVLAVQYFYANLLL